MKAKSLRELYVEELKDLYDAEHQISKALPRMISEVSSEQLRSALNEHLQITKQQAGRIERIFENMGEKLKGEKCKGMEGIIKEGNDVAKKVEDEDVRDAAIISTAQRVEHYEIAAYGTVRTYAQLLGEQESAQLLEQTLDEDKEADQELSQLVEQINVEAGEGERVAEARAGRPTSRVRRAA